MKKILFICLGNSERSVLAEGIYNSQGGFSDSVGMHITKSPRNPFIYKILDTYGINIRDKQKKQFKQSLIAKYKHIYILCNQRYCPNYLINSSKVTFWDIPDPRGENEDFLIDVKNQIVKKLQTIKK